jgi:UDP-glucose 4-epimerase
MSVLVTGGAGYIGSHMVWHLLDAGEAVVVVDNLATGFDWAIAPEAQFVAGDCGDEALIGGLIAEHKVDAIIHFAAAVVVPESVADPLGYYLNNTVKARSLLAAAVAGGVRHFVFSSTAAVYGTPATTPVPEDAPLLPQSPYGRSKIMVETMLADSAAAYDFSCHSFQLLLLYRCQFCFCGINSCNNLTLMDLCFIPVKICILSYRHQQ